MDISLYVRPRINKKNGQANISLPKKKLRDLLGGNPRLDKLIKIRLEGLE